MKKLSERKRDILILLIVVLISCPISYFMKDVGNVWDQPFSFIWYAFLVFTCFFSYLESRDKDPFVTGKTERMGVMNSFTAAAFLIGVVSKWFVGWVGTAVFVSVCLFISRELGRYSYKKREKKYLHQTGTLLGDLPNKAKAEIHGKKVTVWSRDEIKKGTQICVTEMKGTYLYVSAVDQKQSSASFDL